MNLNTERVRDYLHEQFIDQNEFAELTGLTPQTVSVMLKRGTASKRTISKLAAVTGIDPQELTRR